MLYSKFGRLIIISSVLSLGMSTGFCVETPSDISDDFDVVEPTLPVSNAPKTPKPEVIPIKMEGDKPTNTTPTLPTQNIKPQVTAGGLPIPVSPPNAQPVNIERKVSTPNQALSGQLQQPSFVSPYASSPYASTPPQGMNIGGRIMDAGMFNDTMLFQGQEIQRLTNQLKIKELQVDIAKKDSDIRAALPSLPQPSANASGSGGGESEKNKEKKKDEHEIKPLSFTLNGTARVNGAMMAYISSGSSDWAAKSGDVLPGGYKITEINASFIFVRSPEGQARKVFPG